MDLSRLCAGVRVCRVGEGFQVLFRETGSSSPPKNKSLRAVALGTTKTSKAPTYTQPHSAIIPIHASVSALKLFSPSPPLSRETQAQARRGVQGASRFPTNYSPHNSNRLDHLPPEVGTEAERIALGWDVSSRNVLPVSSWVEFVLREILGSTGKVRYLFRLGMTLPFTPPSNPSV